MTLCTWTGDDLFQTVWLLSIFADDERVCLQEPPRVVVALQTYGHLLCDQEREMVDSWLTEIAQPRRRQNA
jgi:hypothetical protein